MKKSIHFIFFLVLTVSNMTMIELTWAQTKPSVPEFTLKYVDNSYDYYAPPVITTSTNPYNGSKTVTTQLGYTQHVENKSIEIKIQNQALVLTLQNETLYYNVRVKGHFGGNWTEVYSYTYSSPGMIISSGSLPSQSNGEFTVLSYPVAGYPTNTQLDFQVQAFLGVYYTSEPASHDPFIPPHTEFGVLADGETGWSNTQTIAINPSASPLTVSLSESASALNYGNTINFTVTTDGGTPPYNFTWYVDSQVSQSGTSPYFSINSLAVGSHHVYVQVSDANGNSATTLTVSFEVLSVSSPSSPSPSIPEFPLWIILPVLAITTLFAVKLVRTKKTSLLFS